MSIETAEQLKREWTDRYVTVREGVPELRRFVGFVGQVKTVNMNCRALVEFNSPEDISWYDIDPSFLTVTTAPTETTSAPKKTDSKKTAAPKTAAKTQAGGGKASGLSPLVQARQQGAGGGASETKPAPAKAGGSAPAGSKAAGSKGLSPLELARQQGAAGSSPTAAGNSPDTAGKADAADSGTGAQSETPSSKAKSPGKPTAVKSTTGLSPLEQARQQGAIGSKPKTPSDSSSKPSDSPETSAAIQPLMSSGTESSSPPAKPSAPAKKSTAGMSPLELARQQGAIGSQSTSGASGDNSDIPPSPGDSASKAKEGSTAPADAAEQASSTASAIVGGSLGATASAAASAGSGTETPESTGLSPLELARKQGAIGSQSDATKSDSDTPTVADKASSKNADDSAATRSSDGSAIDKALSAADGGVENPVAKKRGSTTRPDDLKIVEGIGPKIEQLLKDAGIATWTDLAQTPAETIKDILTEAGPRFRMHDPTSWPLQAGLAATDKWDELEQLQDELQGGR